MYVVWQGLKRSKQEEEEEEGEEEEEDNDNDDNDHIWGTKAVSIGGTSQVSGLAVLRTTSSPFPSGSLTKITSILVRIFAFTKKEWRRDQTKSRQA